MSSCGVEWLCLAAYSDPHSRHPTQSLFHCSMSSHTEREEELAVAEHSPSPIADSVTAPSDLADAHGSAADDAQQLLAEAMEGEGSLQGGGQKALLNDMAEAERGRKLWDDLDSVHFEETANKEEYKAKAGIMGIGSSDPVYIPGWTQNVGRHAYPLSILALYEADQFCRQDESLRRNFLPWLRGATARSRRVVGRDELIALVNKYKAEQFDKSRATNSQHHAAAAAGSAAAGSAAAGSASPVVNEGGAAGLRERMQQRNIAEQHRIRSVMEPVLRGDRPAVASAVCDQALPATAHGKK